MQDLLRRIDEHYSRHYPASQRTPLTNSQTNNRNGVGRMILCAYCHKPIRRYAIELEGACLHIDCVADYTHETIAFLEATEGKDASDTRTIEQRSAA